MKPERRPATVQDLHPETCASRPPSSSDPSTNSHPLSLNTTLRYAKTRQRCVFLFDDEIDKSVGHKDSFDNLFTINVRRNISVGSGLPDDSRFCGIFSNLQLGP